MPLIEAFLLGNRVSFGVISREIVVEADVAKYLPAVIIAL
jgi:hypothetical protein